MAGETCRHCGARVAEAKGLCPYCRLRPEVRRSGRPAKGRGGRLSAPFFLYWAALFCILYGCAHESMDSLGQLDRKSWALLVRAFVAVGLLAPILFVLYLLG